jgi:hypothetical protein
MSIGTAKPTPSLAPERLKIETLIPITRPSRSTRGPPELPGLMAASVCSTARADAPAGMAWSTAEMIPAVTVP